MREGKVFARKWRWLMLVDECRGGDGSAGGYGYCCGHVGEAFAYMKKLYYLCNRNKEGGNTLP